MKLWLKQIDARRGASWPATGLLASLCLLAFSNIFTNEFVFDDRRYIVNNSWVKSLDTLPEIFIAGYRSTPREAGGFYYRPLSTATYAINYALGGFNPIGYHLVNLILHFGVTLAVYRLALLLGYSCPAALAGASLFAVHPIHTEAVTWVVGRAELLMSLGVLLALLWYIRGSASGRLKLGYVLASWGAFVLALLSKEQALMLPLLVILYELAFRRTPAGSAKSVRNAMVRCSAYFVFPAALVLFRTLSLGKELYPAGNVIAFVDNPLAHVDWATRFLTAIKVAGKYLWLCVWPQHLSADYSYNAIPISSVLWEPEIFASLLAWGGLLALAMRCYFRGSGLAFFAVGFTAITFLPVSNLLLPIGTIMGERLFYLPSVGLVLLIGTAWDGLRSSLWLRNTRRFVGGAGLPVFGAVLILLTARTLFRNRDWRNEVSLFQSALQVVPGSAKVHLNFGALKSDVDEALSAYEEAIRIYPDYVKNDALLAGNYGSALLAKGRVEDAVPALEQAVALGATRTEFHYNLGFAYTKLARWKDAEEAYTKALVLDLEDPAPRNGLSFVLWKQGRYEDAIKAAEDAIQLRADFWEAHYNRARALDSLGRREQAAAAYEKVLRLKASARREAAAAGD
ncbi:MAG: tetratricopeptide repeat protein [Deltaproteobacteria bacterium]|nr:tetratricopeptide repeat protein [Deltaproteobacteria bacterium]